MGRTLQRGEGWNDDEDDEDGDDGLSHSPGQVDHGHDEDEKHEGSNCNSIHPNLQLPICREGRGVTGPTTSSSTSITTTTTTTAAG